MSGPRDLLTEVSRAAPWVGALVLAAGHVVVDDDLRVFLRLQHDAVAVVPGAGALGVHVDGFAIALVFEQQPHLVVGDDLERAGGMQGLGCVGHGGVWGGGGGSCMQARVGVQQQRGAHAQECIRWEKTS